MDNYFSFQPNFPKIEYPFGCDWLFLEQQLPPDNLILELPPLQTTYEPNLSPLSNNYDKLTDFQDFENFIYGFPFENSIIPSTNEFGDEMALVVAKPHLTSFDQNNKYEEMLTSDICTEVSRMVGIREMYAKFEDSSNSSSLTTSTTTTTKVKKCNVGLELSEIQKYFDVPIKEAAKELGIGVTRLKKRCRELGIMRWPHRKFRSLKFLISNVKKMGVDKDDIIMLEEQKRLLEKTPNLELTLKAKKLRQACFKANYKNKRAIALSRH